MDMENLNGLFVNGDKYLFTRPQPSNGEKRILDNNRNIVPMYGYGQ